MLILFLYESLHHVSFAFKNTPVGWSLKTFFKMCTKDYNKQPLIWGYLQMRLRIRKTCINNTVKNRIEKLIILV